MYITIDGDDTGRKIVSCYINNDEAKLREISESLALSIYRVTDLLKVEGFRIVFSAADGVAAHTSIDIDYMRLFDRIRGLAPTGFTFSVGVGSTLQEAYIALVNAKSSGKNSLSLYWNINGHSE